VTVNRDSAEDHVAFLFEGWRMFGRQKRLQLLTGDW
jgi:hypothetical protein